MIALMPVQEQYLRKAFLSAVLNKLKNGMINALTQPHEPRRVTQLVADSLFNDLGHILGIAHGGVGSRVG